MPINITNVVIVNCIITFDLVFIAKVLEVIIVMPSHRFVWQHQKSVPVGIKAELIDVH